MSPLQQQMLDANYDAPRLVLTDADIERIAEAVVRLLRLPDPVSTPTPMLVPKGSYEVAPGVIMVPHGSALPVPTYRDTAQSVRALTAVNPAFAQTVWAPPPNGYESSKYARGGFDGGLT